MTKESFDRRNFNILFTGAAAGLGGLFFNECVVKPICKFLHPTYEIEVKQRDGIYILGENCPLVLNNCRYGVTVNSRAMRDVLDVVALEREGEDGKKKLDRFLESNPLGIYLFSDIFGYGANTTYTSSLYDTPHINFPGSYLSLYRSTIEDPLNIIRDLKWVETKYILHELFHFCQNVFGDLNVVNNSIAFGGGSATAVGVKIAQANDLDHPFAFAVGGSIGVLTLLEMTRGLQRGVVENVDEQVNRLYNLSGIQQHKGKFFSFRKLS